MIHLLLCEPYIGILQELNPGSVLEIGRLSSMGAIGLTLGLENLGLAAKSSTGRRWECNITLNRRTRCARWQDSANSQYVMRASIAPCLTSFPWLRNTQIVTQETKITTCTAKGTAHRHRQCFLSYNGRGGFSGRASSMPSTSLASSKEDIVRGPVMNW